MPAAPASRASRLAFSEVVALLTLALALGFVLVYQPVARRAELMDKPLRQAWDAFARTNQSSVATAGVAMDKLPARLELLQTASTELAELRRLAVQHIELAPRTLELVQAPFQLIDFDNERFRLGEEVMALARTRKVQLQPSVTNGLPRYPAESAPAFLWPRLHIAHQLLLTAIHCQVGAILELSQLAPITHRSPGDDRRLFEELPMRLEVAGAVEPLARFLASLPLRGTELERTALGSALTNKPALFIGQVLVRKAAPDRPSDARLEIIVSGFVPASGPRRTL